ncbi:MAG TPA: universal stress protein [Nitrospira sp.]|nr:universal stress protein [Nitrospira sp.]
MATGPFEKILVPVDFSSCSDEAFGVALRMAALFGAELFLLHVIDIGAIAAFNRLGLLAVPSEAIAQRRRLRHQARLKIREMRAAHPSEGVAIKRVVVEGTPFVEIAKAAREEGIDLIVMGSYGGRSDSMDKIFFGATAEKVVRTAGCAVLTVPLPAKRSRKDLVL